MKLPRKGILIRLAIYLPIIGALVIWRACYFDREEIVEPASAPAEPGRERTIAGPDGQEFKVIEITPDEAKAMGVEMPEKPGEPAEQRSNDP